MENDRARNCIRGNPLTRFSPSFPHPPPLSSPSSPPFYMHFHYLYTMVKRRNHLRLEKIQDEDDNDGGCGGGGAHIKTFQRTFFLYNAFCFWKRKWRKHPFSLMTQTQAVCSDATYCQHCLKPPHLFNVQYPAIKFFFSKGLLQMFYVASI